MTKKVPLPTLLSVMKPIVRPVMLEYFRPDCCVATCKILREVFTNYGYKSREVPVIAMIFNAKMQKLLEQGPLPHDPGERNALLEATGAWGIGVGIPGPPQHVDSYVGHLVLNVQGLLVDGSLDQAQREKKDILLPPLLWIRPGSGFFAPTAKGQQIRGDVGECLVTYKRLRNDSYRQGPNWRENYAGRPEAYFKIMRLLKERLFGTN